MCLKCTNENFAKLRKEYDAANDPEEIRQIQNKMAIMSQQLCEDIVNTEFSTYGNDRNDLISIGMWESVRCLGEWKPEKAKPLTFLNRRIRWKLRVYTYRYVGNPTGINKNLVNKASNWKAYIESTSDSGKSKEESIQDLANAENTSPEKIKEKLSYLESKSPIYYQDLPDNDLYSPSNIGDEYEREEFYAELSRIIWRYCDNALEFELFRMKYDPFDEGFGMTIAEMANILNITSGMISKRMSKIHRKIVNDPDQRLLTFLRNARDNK